MHNDLLFTFSKTESLVRWRNRLKGEFALTVDADNSYKLDFCDSFDWRLFAAGLRLERWCNAGGCFLRLIRVDADTVVAEQRVRSERVRFAEELPPGVIRTTLMPLLEMRAFIPLAGLKVHSFALRDDDKEGKTRARVFIESFTITNPSGRSSVLRKCVRLQALRGYGKSAGRIQRKLEKKYHLSVDEDRLFEQALECSGRHPGDYSSKLKIPLQAAMRADKAVRGILQALFSAMQMNEAGTIADRDSEFLHDFRVAVRRTRSVLGELKKIFPPATLKRFKREFAWLGGLTSTVRDLDVYLLKFNGYQAALPRSRRDGLEPLRTFLQHKQRTEQAQLALALKGPRYRKLKLQWQRYLDAPLASRPTAPDAAKKVVEVSDRRIRRMYKRVMREASAINDESPHTELHELRKSCKKLRYLMEFFQSLYPRKAIRALIRELKQLQENLGDFQDLDVQIEAMQRFAMEMRRRGEYSDATGQSMDALLKSLHAEMACVRADFHLRFERFSRPRNRGSFEKLFHSDRAVSSE